MNLKRSFLQSRIVREENGQIIAWMAILMTLLFAGFSALVIDVGRAVVAYHMLQSSTDAAVMAGAQVMPSATSNSTVTNKATLYSSVPGNKNANAAMLPNAAMVDGYPKLYCSTTVRDDWHVPCNGNLTSTTGNGANAIVVSQTIALPMYFASWMGFPTMNITATSTAAMRGSPRSPYNVAVVVDTTASMNSTDGKTSDCSGTRVSCALQGVLTLLGDLSPCASGSSCGSVVSGTSNVSNPIDEVALYTFPGLTSSSAATNDATCNKSISKSNISTYNYPTMPVYQIVPYSSDYASSDPTTVNESGSASSLLNNSSLLVQASGKTIPSTNGCGLNALGGVATYFAGVITQAQADLVAQQTARAPQATQNVMIILSDGDATATTSDMTYTNSVGTYPSFFNECQQAVNAAQAASTAGTEVYTVAYGTQSSGCSSDQNNASVTISSETGSGPWTNCTANTGRHSSGYTCTNSSPSGLSPCQTMQNMATSSAYFFSDYVAGGNGGSNDSSCTGASGSDTNLNDIFGFIASGLSTARLMPNGTP